MSRRLEMYDREFLPSQPDLPVDLASLDQLRQSVGSDELMQRPGRVYFNVAIICTAGEGLHEVDFIPITLQPGRVVHVQPGQIHRWCLSRSYEATIVFFPDGVDNEIRSDGWPIGPRWFDLTDAELDRSQRIIDLMRREYSIERSKGRRDRALKGALQLLIVNLGLDRGRQTDSSRLPKPYLDLMDQLESERDWSRSVNERAERLGYSARTVSRACQAAIGRTAKQVVDDRVVLEARRLLIRADNTIEEVAHELSFNEASNFTKFFRRLTGENPDSWRMRRSFDGSAGGTRVT
jgi:AraC-like DNA-binding protein